MLTRRRFLSTLPVAGTAAHAEAAQPARANRRPNILVILADDQGWGDLSVHGNKNLATPHIDSLARDGALFDRFYVCSVCAPTRAEFLTGRYHPRGGVRGVSTGAERLNLDEKTIADSFKAAGYATGAFGKWHNGTQHPYHPNARGFDEYYGFTSGHWGQYFDPELDHNGRRVRGKGFIIDDLTDHAMRFMEVNQRRPFFCYLPLNTPHSPMQVPDSFYQRFGDRPINMTARDASQEDIAFTRAALAMCENIDWNVGRVLAHLDKLNLARDTIVFYFSDNGPNSWRWNGGMKGRKGTVDEGGLRVPALMRWSGSIAPGTRIPQIAGAIDLLPTFAEMAGVSPLSNGPLDGRSLKPLLVRDPDNAKQAAWPDRMLFSLWNKRATVRTQQYRLDPAGALFDMQADPGQTKDVAAERPEAAARLKKALAEWTAEMLPKVGRDDRPFPAGYAEETLLPARDGVPRDGVERSASAPNCSYFTGWKTKEGSMTWDIEVGRAGEFEATVLYTCPRGSEGSRVELSFQGARIEAVVKEPHDPPLVGAAFDRVPRKGESYVKDFKPMRLGAFKLPAGRGLLTLRALDIPGAAVADVRSIVLRRLG